MEIAALNYLKLVSSNYIHPENLSFKIFDQSLLGTCDISLTKDMDYEEVKEIVSLCGIVLSYPKFELLQQYLNYKYLEIQELDFSEVGYNLEDWISLAKSLNIQLSALHQLYKKSLFLSNFNDEYSKEKDFRVLKHLAQNRNLIKDNFYKILDKNKVFYADETDTQIFNSAFNCGVDFIFPNGWIINDQLRYWIILTEDFFVSDDYPVCEYLPGAVIHLHGFVGSNDGHYSLEYNDNFYEEYTQIITTREVVKSYRDLILDRHFEDPELNQIISHSEIPRMENKRKKTLDMDQLAIKKTRNYVDKHKKSLTKIKSLKIENKIDAKTIQQNLDLLAVTFYYEQKFNVPSINPLESGRNFYRGNYIIKMLNVLKIDTSDVAEKYNLTLDDFYYESAVNMILKASTVEFLADREIYLLKSPFTPDFLFKNHLIYNGKKCYWMEMKPHFERSQQRQIANYILSYGPGILFLEGGYQKVELIYKSVNEYLEMYNIEIDLSEYLFIFNGREYYPQITYEEF